MIELLLHKIVPTRQEEFQKMLYSLPWLCYHCQSLLHLISVLYVSYSHYQYCDSYSIPTLLKDFRIMVLSICRRIIVASVSQYNTFMYLQLCLHTNAKEATAACVPYSVATQILCHLQCTLTTFHTFLEPSVASCFNPVWKS